MILDESPPMFTISRFAPDFSQGDLEHVCAPSSFEYIQYGAPFDRDILTKDHDMVTVDVMGFDPDLDLHEQLCTFLSQCYFPSKLP